MQTDWRTARAESERHPCPYVAPPLTSSRRRRSEDSSQRCDAQVGQTCRDPRTGRPLMGQPAHLVRQRLAGVDAEPCMSAAYTA